jgi:dipeptidase E
MTLERRRVMLVSNSYQPGQGFFEHCLAAVSAFLGPARRVAFVPWAARAWGPYTETVRAAFQPAGIEIVSVHEAPHAADVIERAEAILIGGGNTFRLLDRLWRQDAIEPIRSRVDDGMPYVGSSAGSNVAGPTIMTTNDMPIVRPRSFASLALVPFQINPHYLDPDPNSTHMGESREKRIAEYHEEAGNDWPVLGLREGSWATVERGVATLFGAHGARWFEKGAAPRELGPGPLPAGATGAGLRPGD